MMIGHLCILGLLVTVAQVNGLAVKCDIKVTLTYPGNSGAPEVTCSTDCAENRKNWFKETLFYHDSTLKETFDQIVQINFSDDGDIECKLAPSSADTTTGETDHSFRIQVENVDLEVMQKVTSLPACPRGWFLNKENKMCYHVSGTAKTWQDSSAYCDELGSTLASFASAEESNFVVEQLSDSVWTGLKDVDDSGVFSWADGTIYDFQNWASQESSDHSEQCVSMDSSNGFLWTTASCSSKVKALCYKRAEMFPRSQCPHGWNADNTDGCYRVSAKTANYDDASSNCALAAVRSSLVTPQTEEENLFIRNLVEGDIWLGVNDKDDEGYFQTSEGDIQTYFNWDTFEPNNLFNEDCVEMDEDGYWNDEGCHEVFHYMCKTPKNLPIPDDVLAEAMESMAR